MIPADTIKTEPLLFDKLLEPISAPLLQLDQHSISRAAKKLTYLAFVRVLLFRIFDQIRSLRDLTLDLNTRPEARLLNLPIVGLSTVKRASPRSFTFCCWPPFCGRSCSKPLSHWPRQIPQLRR